jgi:electron transfer flavoprotein alpha subunit
MSIRINTHTCTGCGRCVSACAYAAIEMHENKARLVPGHCVQCGACIETCPVQAIEETPDTQQTAEDTHASWKDVAVIMEPGHDGFHEVSYELLAAGRSLADDLGQRLRAVVPGHHMHTHAAALGHYGAHIVHYYDDPVLAVFDDDPYVTLISRFIETYKPSIVLCGATPVGRSMIPQVAARVHTGLTADCTALQIDTHSQLLEMTRPAFGGNLMATIVCPSHRPQMATVRPHALPRARYDASRDADMIMEALPQEALRDRCRILERIPFDQSAARIADADIIVSGGRGMQGPSHFSLLQRCAELLDGAVGASRAAVDAGWIPYTHQIGQTGKTVSPSLYIACGISGAVQHLAGIAGAGRIIAINNDPDAPIFAHADLGIVGDVFEILPRLITSLEQRSSHAAVSGPSKGKP